MVVNIDALGLRADLGIRSWAVKDTLLYALGVGAGIDDLELTTENSEGTNLVTLPTMAAILGGGAGPLREQLGNWEPSQVVHGTQWINLTQSLATEGKVRIETEVTAIEDKGSGALIELTAVANSVDTDATVFHSRTGLFVRGEGGFGDTGSYAKKLPHSEVPPGVTPVEITEQTREDQALLYRLNGDRNPLHSDPSFAKKAGFSRPILHGLCTWGIAARVFGRTVLDREYPRITGFGGRFRSPVLPGERLTLCAWPVEPRKWSFVVSVADRVVIDSGIVEIAE